MDNSIDNSLPPYIFIHGFLGRPEDWQSVQRHLREKIQNPFVSINLWNMVDATCSLKNLAKKIELHCPPQSVLVGYSLGGRILMHISEATLKQVRRVVVLSSHVGLKTDAEKKERQKADNGWAQKFLDDPWDSLMKSWNQQEVFAQDTTRPARSESHYDRIQLARVLQKSSLDQQDRVNLEDLAEIVPVTFMVGEKDRKFLQLQNELALENPSVRFQIVGGAGHYVLEDGARSIANELSRKD